MNALEMHRWVEEFNWDDDLVPIRELIDDSQTQFATALLIYWRLGGPWSDPSRTDNDASRLLEFVRNRLINGFYPKGELRYEPATELSRTQVYKFQKAGVASELLTPQWPE